MSSLPPGPRRSGSTPGTFSADAYFDMQPAPENLEVVVRGVEEFIAQQMREKRRVVLVTVSRYFPSIPATRSFISHFIPVFIIKGIIC
jgi:hypothetical protein